MIVLNHVLKKSIPVFVLRSIYFYYFFLAATHFKIVNFLGLVPQFEPVSHFKNTGVNKKQR